MCQHRECHPRQGSLLLKFFTSDNFVTKLKRCGLIHFFPGEANYPFRLDADTLTKTGICIRQLIAESAAMAENLPRVENLVNCNYPK